MKLVKLIFKNILRHPLRNILTIIGVAIAIMLFGLLETIITAWNSGVDASSESRLICRQAASFILPLPYTHLNDIKKVPGVENLCPANWFGGVYKDKNQFFARMAVDQNTLFDLFPEFEISPKEIEAFKTVKNGCVIGSGLQERYKDQYDLKIGDRMVLEGDIYPGKWEFQIVGVYKAKTKVADATQMFFRYDFVNDRLALESPEGQNKIGWVMIKIKKGANPAAVSKAIDAQFANSSSETKTEDERAFNKGFTSAFSVIIVAIQALSYIIIGIILLVLSNTMIMSARERTREYAVLRTLGFTGSHIFWFVSGEAFLITLIGSVIGTALLLPMAYLFSFAMPKGWFPVFYVATNTWIMMAVMTLIVALLAALFPVYRAVKTKIVDGLRFAG